jgi:hypothetical protein
MRGFPDHQAVAELIARWGLEKFLEIVGEQCADFGSQCRSKHLPIQNNMKANWEMIGENLRGLASLARTANIHLPFVLDLTTGKMKGSSFRDVPTWKL